MIDLDRWCAHDCRRHAIVWWTLIRDDHDPRPDRDWYVCGVHSDQCADALTAKGWVQMADERDEVTPAVPCAPST